MDEEGQENMKRRKQISLMMRVRKATSERGVALIFTLGILGLLTVMALGFASTAMLNRKIADNNANIQGARFLARTGLERVIGGLQAGKNADNIFSKTLKNASGTDSEEYRSADWMWKLDTRLDGYTIFELSDNYNPDTDVSWQYVRDPLSTHSPNKEILGRFAYITAVDKGKLDPSVHFGKSLDASEDVSAGRKGKNEWEINLADGVRDYSVDPDKLRSPLKNATTDTNSPRRWADMSEVFETLGTLTTDQKTSLKNALATKLSPDSEAFWLDMNNNEIKDNEEFFHRFNIGPRSYFAESDTDAASEWDEAKFDNADILFADAKNYSVNIAGNATGEPDTGGIPWLKYWSHSQGDWTAEVMAKQIAANIIQYNRNQDSVTVSDVQDDWAATGTASEPTYAGLGRHPYINEVGASLRITFVLTKEGNDTDGYVYSYTYTPELNCGIELIDIYGLTADEKKDYEVYFYGKYSFDCNAPEGNTSKWTSVATSENAEGDLLVKRVLTDSDWVGYTKDTSFWWTGGGDGESKFEMSSVSGSFKVSAALGDDAVKKLFSVKNVKLYIRKVVLKKKTATGSFNRDFSKLMNDDSNIFVKDAATWTDTEAIQGYQLATEDKTGTRTIHFLRAFETEDPRVNHYPSDWTTVTDAVGNTDVMTEYKGTAGAKNTGVDPSNVTDGDKEKATDPAATAEKTPAISTAYIRHDPMESLWELGAISRAEKWKTLNLKTGKNIGKYTDGANRTGGGTYADGDANILDQVKLTAKTAVYGKLNLNTDNHKLLYALFKGIKNTDGTSPYSFYESFNGKNEFAGFSDHAEDASVDTGCIACLIKELPDFKTRIDFLAGDATSDSDKITAIQNLLVSDTFETDAAQEQVIGKFINLTKADATDIVYVVVLGQSIKEVNAPVIFKNWIGTVNESVTHAPTNSESSSVFKAYRRAGYVRPPRAGETKSKIFMPLSHFPEEQKLKDKISTEMGRYDLGADRITGEAKIIALLFLDKSSSKWKIQRFEYVE